MTEVMLGWHTSALACAVSFMAMTGARTKSLYLGTGLRKSGKAGTRIGGTGV